MFFVSGFRFKVVRIFCHPERSRRTRKKLRNENPIFVGFNLAIPIAIGSKGAKFFLNHRLEDLKDFFHADSTDFSRFIFDYNNICVYLLKSF